MSSTNPTPKFYGHTCNRWVLSNSMFHFYNVLTVSIPNESAHTSLLNKQITIFKKEIVLFCEVSWRERKLCLFVTVHYWLRGNILRTIIIILNVFNDFIVIHIINFPVKNDSISLPTITMGDRYETFRRKQYCFIVQWYPTQKLLASGSACTWAQGNLMILSQWEIPAYQHKYYRMNSTSAKKIIILKQHYCCKNRHALKLRMCLSLSPDYWRNVKIT